MNIIYDHLNTPPGTMTVHHIGDSSRLVVWNNKHGIDQYGECWTHSAEENTTLWDRILNAWTSFRDFSRGSRWAIEH